ncbi:MAG: hypothetical protein EOP48_31860, partial [Sphingobacteriales bacterium]
MKRHKSINLIFVTCLLMINGCKELPKPGNKIILLNDEILQSDSLRIMYQRNAIIYKPYEGFLIFTNDTVFTNPILTPTNSTSLIESDVLSHSDILNALDNSIEKVSYHIPIEDLNRKQNILSLLAKKYLRANRQRMIERFPIYRELADIAEKLNETANITHYLNEQFLIDLGFWYHLSWLSETLRRTDHRVQAWQNKGRGFSTEDRVGLLKLIGEQISSIGPRYRALYEKGQIELCMSPYAHPIVPLLLDINSTRQAWPEVTLPNSTHYSGGEQRANWHLEHGIKTFEHYFGHRPRGIWPSEGSLSDETLKLLGKAGFEWTATGDSVLQHSLK